MTAKFISDLRLRLQRQVLVSLRGFRLQERLHGGLVLLVHLDSSGKQISLKSGGRIEIEPYAHAYLVLTQSYVVKFEMFKIQFFN